MLDIIAFIMVFAAGIAQGWLLGYVRRDGKTYDECRRMLDETRGQHELMRALIANHRGEGGKG